jgi:rhamnosyltransferase
VPDNKVCAVVVTFHPREKEFENLRKLRLQVEELVVVDNGSSPPALESLRKTSRDLNLILIENSQNLGIATALNRGVRMATERRQKWIALFDQDSTVTEGFIDAMLADYGVLARQRNIIQIIPRYKDPETNEEEYVPRDADGGPFITRTSGSFFPVEAFQKCGYFTEELFIYCVDDDYSLRLRSLGFSIAESENAVLLHHAGKPTPVKVFGKVFLTRNYRPEVQYYWARNRVWLVRKYGWRYPHLIYSSLRSLFGIPLKIILAEKGRWLKICMFSRGILDGVLGKTGQRINIY